jgi:hypothetical protein
MRNAPGSIKGFGCDLHGQDEAGRMLAEYVDKKFEMVGGVNDARVKENFQQPVCVHGVGCGKSAVLSRGLALHKKHCRNWGLQELLKEESHPLAIHITFNSDTLYGPVVEPIVHSAVIRRILASCLDLDWPVVRDLPLSDSISVLDCLRAIISYHKTVHGMKEDQKVFVYLGIDEVNMLVRDTGASSNVDALKDLVIAVQGLRISDGFVSSVLAGTHFAAMTESFLGSGVKPLNLMITRLSKEVIENMIKADAGVSEKYLNDLQFQKLLRDVGPVMRAIGLIVKELEYEYDPQSVTMARYSAVRYFRNACSPLTEEESLALCGLVLTGVPVNNPSARLSNASVITLDKLQNNGTIMLVPWENEDAYSVFMSRFMLDIYCSYMPDHPLVKTGQKLLSYIDSRGSDTFEKFIAHFHAMKMAYFLKVLPAGSGVPVTLFFSGALIGGGLTDQMFQLAPPTFSPIIDDGVKWLVGERYLDFSQRKGRRFTVTESEVVAQHLKSGGVVLNSQGAAVDILSTEKVRDAGSSQWKDGLTVYAGKHTKAGGMKLMPSHVIEDHDKAMKGILASKNHSKALITMVHFSNRELSKDLVDTTTWKAEWQRSVIVGRNNIERVVGPLLGRMLTSSGHYGGGRGARSFCTLARAVSTVGVNVGRVQVAFIRRLLG